MFKGKQIKFLEEETAKLNSQSQNQDQKINAINGKLSDLEKLMESTKESLNQLSASKFESISKEIQEFNAKVENSMQSLEKLRKDMGELTVVNQTLFEIKNSIDELKTKSNELSTNSIVNKGSIDTINTDLQTLIISSKTDISKLQADFEETKEVVQTVKTELQEERQKVFEGQETIMKQEVTINEKTSQLEKLEKELKESRALIGKLEAQKDTLDKELRELRDGKDKQYKDLTKLQEDFTTYKQTNEQQFTFNAAVKRLMEQSTEGKILLELFKKSPQSMDALSDKIQVAAVILKTAINTLQDINAIKVDSETRMVSL